MAKPRCCVFVARCPRSFKPAHQHTQPDEILGGKFLARRLSLEKAIQFATAYNLAHLPSTGKFKHKWAMAMADLKRSYAPPRPRSERAAAEAAGREGAL